MPNRKWSKVQTIGHDRKIVEGSFAPAGAGAPTGVKGSGVLSVSRTGVGHFSVVTDKYPALESATATVSSAATLLHAQMVDTGVGFVNLRIVDAAGVAQDLVADPDNRVSFRFVFRNSTRR